MTRENQQRVEEEIRLRNWIRIEEGSPLPEENVIVGLIYENMDGQPCRCKAHISEGRWRGDSDWVKGNYMCACIAWREYDEDLLI